MNWITKAWETINFLSFRNKLLRRATRRSAGDTKSRPKRSPRNCLDSKPLQKCFPFFCRREQKMLYQSKHSVRKSGEIHGMFHSSAFRVDSFEKHNELFLFYRLLSDELTAADTYNFQLQSAQINWTAILIEKSRKSIRNLLGKLGFVFDNFNLPPRKIPKTFSSPTCAVIGSQSVTTVTFHSIVAIESGKFCWM